MPAIEIFSLALKYLVAKLLKFISDTTGLTTIHSGNIQWVLTVPAIWKPGARQFMRNAAYKVTEYMHSYCTLELVFEGLSCVFYHC